MVLLMAAAVSKDRVCITVPAIAIETIQRDALLGIESLPTKVAVLLLFHERPLDVRLGSVFGSLEPLEDVAVGIPPSIWVALSILFNEFHDSGEDFSGGHVSSP
jgi:hypothetical protein